MLCIRTCSRSRRSQQMLTWPVRLLASNLFTVVYTALVSMIFQSLFAHFIFLPWRMKLSSVSNSILVVPSWLAPLAEIVTLSFIFSQQFPISVSGSTSVKWFDHLCDLSFSVAQYSELIIHRPETRQCAAGPFKLGAQSFTIHCVRKSKTPQFPPV